MIDLKEKNIDQSAVPKASADTSAVVQPRPMEKSAQPCVEKEKKHEKSKGEAWFENFFYWKINYWLNLGMSLIATDFFTHEGKGGFFTANGTGKKLLDNGSRRLANVVEALGIAKAEKAFSSTRAGLKTLALNTGGWLLLPVIFLAERHKRAIVHWKNRKLGVDQRAEDGHEMTPDEIYIDDEQPKQSFLWAMGRRALASGSTIVTGVLLDKVATTKNPLTGAIIYGQDRVTGLVKDMVNNTVKLTHIPGNQAFVKNGFIQRYLGFAALDTVYTWMTATVMEKTNGAEPLRNGKAKKFREIGRIIDQANVPEQQEKNGNGTVPASGKTIGADNKTVAKVVSPSLEDKYKTKPVQPVDKYHTEAGEPNYSMVT